MGLVEDPLGLEQATWHQGHNWKPRLGEWGIVEQCRKKSVHLGPSQKADHGVKGQKLAVVKDEGVEWMDRIWYQVDEVPDRVEVERKVDAHGIQDRVGVERKVDAHEELPGEANWYS